MPERYELLEAKSNVLEKDLEDESHLADVEVPNALVEDVIFLIEGVFDAGVIVEELMHQ